MAGVKQETAAAAAGMSERTARKWAKGSLPSEVERERTWRTREDPLIALWESDVVPLLEADRGGRLQAKTILEELKRQHPKVVSDRQLRTLQRRVRDYRAVHGQDKEVYFEQSHPPGREAAFDFTHMSELGVTIGGERFAHLLFVMKLSFSGWTFACLARGETFEAMCHGIQSGLWSLGGVVDVLRSDNLSAATHELKSADRRVLTQRYGALLEHYNVSSSRIRPGRANENGVAEKANHLVKSGVEQALLVRGNRDFGDVESYTAFVASVVAKLNARPRVVERLAVERMQLAKLPNAKVPEYTAYEAKVRKWSTIRVGDRTYSVPSSLIGHDVEARQYADVVEVRYKGRQIETMPRLRGSKSARIDYRHVIWSLARKPGAFARYRFREELFPTLTFRKAYDRLREQRGERCDVEYVRILHLAASTMQADVDLALQELLGTGAELDFAVVKARVSPKAPQIPDVKIGAPDLNRFDLLIGGVA